MKRFLLATWRLIFEGSLAALIIVLAFFLFMLWTNLTQAATVSPPGRPAARVVPAEWLAAAAQAEADNHLPAGLVRAVCSAETDWRNVNGAAGEIGVCQIQAATVKMICSTCAGNAHRVLFALGSRGVNVARIQAVLAREGRYQAAVDGLYGPITLKGVVAYQKSHNLAPDGVVGPRTWQAMFGAFDPYPGQTIAQALRDPVTNIAWAGKYLAWLRDNWSADVDLMLVGYNAGVKPIQYVLRVRGRM